MNRGPKYSTYQKVMNSGVVTHSKSPKNIVDISTKEHKNRLFLQNKIVVVDLYADWCGPCMQISPLFEKLSSELSVPGKILFCKENIDLGISTELFTSGKIQGVPSFLIYKNGKIIDVVSGAYIDKVRQKTIDLIKKEI